MHPEETLTDLIHVPVRPANDPCLDAVGRAVWRLRGEHDRQTSNTCPASRIARSSVRCAARLAASGVPTVPEA